MRYFFHSVAVLAVLMPFCTCKSHAVYQSDSDSMSFAVCEVEKENSLFNPGNKFVKPYRDIVITKVIDERNEKERKAYAESDTISDSERSKMMFEESYWPEGLAHRKIESLPAIDKELITCGFHPFVASLHYAYTKHYPITISPDMVWLMIAQGFAVHVNENAEELREQFVDFDGKKVININRPSFVKGRESNNWPGTFAEFSERIEENTGTDLLDLVTGDFSTTGPMEKAAFQVTLMDAMKSYFMYSVTTLCGIPEITLEGTPEDWASIERKAKELAQYDLEWWIDDLLPVLQQFTKASEGKVDKVFWESIYKSNRVGSGSSYITGWVLNFFPYLEQRGKMVSIRAIKKRLKDKKTEFRYRATSSELPSGLSKADFLWNYYGTFYKMELVAGFVACYQDPKTFALRPEMSWAIVDKQLMGTPEDIETYEKGGDKKYLESQEKK